MKPENGMGDHGWYSEQRRKWVALAESWHEGEPPAIPSPQDLRSFTAFALQAVNGTTARILVMGATVALRRALLNDPRLSTAELVTVDFSQEMLAVTTAALARDADLSRETRLVGDWRELDRLLEGQVDAIMADKSFDNVAFADWTDLFASCAAVLRPHGRLVLHVGLVDPDYRGFEPGRALGEWADRLAAGSCDLGEAAAGYWEDLLTASAYVGDFDAHELCVGKFQESLESLRREYDGSSTRGSILAEFDRVFGNSNGSRWTAFDLGDVREKSAAWFDLEGARYSEDYAAARLQPVVELVRNEAPVGGKR